MGRSITLSVLVVRTACTRGHYGTPRGLGFLDPVAPAPTGRASLGLCSPNIEGGMFGEPNTGSLVNNLAKVYGTNICGHPTL